MRRAGSSIAAAAHARLNPDWVKWDRDALERIAINAGLICSRYDIGKEV